MEYEFVPFESIRRLSQGCVITEKIDGTNAQVFIPDDCSTILVGSRSRWITPESDNYGFARWVEENKTELMKLGPGRHFGEWWGQGIQRRYGLTDKRFSLFNAGRWTDDVRPACCSVVPVLYHGAFSIDKIDEVMAQLKKGGSIAAPGFKDPEGIVIWLTASQKLFKKTFDGDKHKFEKAA